METKHIKGAQTRNHRRAFAKSRRLFHSIRKLILAGCLLLCGSAVAAQQNTDPSTLRIFYDDLASPKAIYQFTLSLNSEEDQRELLDLYRYMLEDLTSKYLTYSGFGEDTELQDTIITLLAIMGEFGHESALDIIYPELLSFDIHPVVRGWAYRTIGNLGGTRYGEAIAQRLRDINNQPGNAANNYELTAEAFGCLNAIEVLRYEPAFDAVFEASIGWYVPMMKREARRVLNNLSEDPAEFYLDLATTGDFRTVYNALVYSVESGMDDPAKIHIALETLKRSLGWQTVVQNYDHEQLFMMRSVALNALIELEDRSEESVQTIMDIYRRDDDTSIALLCIQALGINRTEAAVEELNRLMFFFNERLAAGFRYTERELRALEEIIEAYRSIDSPSALTLLRASRHLGYPPNIITRMEDAINIMEG